MKQVLVSILFEINDEGKFVYAPYVLIYINFLFNSFFNVLLMVYNGRWIIDCTSIYLNAIEHEN